MNYIINESTATKLSSVSDALRADMSRPATELNLDATEPDVLMSFWFRYQHGRNYRELFPNGGKHTRTAAGQLANYASNKATAMSCRLRGDITAALVYERISDGIYEALPDWAKGW